VFQRYTTVQSATSATTLENQGFTANESATSCSTSDDSNSLKNKACSTCSTSEPVFSEETHKEPGFFATDAQALLELGKRLGWSEVCYKSGHTLEAGEANWRKFALNTANGQAGRIGEVVAYLERLRVEAVEVPF
jgi:hypothetical protein